MPTFEVIVENKAFNIESVHGGCMNCHMREPKMCLTVSGVAHCTGLHGWRVQHNPHNPYPLARMFTGKLNRERDVESYTPSAGQAVHEVIHILFKFREGYKKHPLYPAVAYCLDAGIWPKDYQLLALEMPHVAEDGVRLAYTQNEQKLVKGISTVTAPGKYLRRHFPDLSDDRIRDIVAMTKPATYAIWRKPDDIVKSAVLGPNSCMRWGDGDGEDEGDSKENYIMGYSCHPYRAYAPEYGWGVAVRLRGNLIVGRCLINDGTFVRSFAATHESDPGVGYSERDTGLELWLKEQGYRIRSGWPEGTKLAETSSIGFDEDMLPYVDGDTYYAERHRGYFCLTCDDDAGIECRNTDGSFDERETYCCEECGSSTSNPCDHVNGGHVCQDCTDSMEYVRGPNGYGYINPGDDSLVRDSEGRAYHIDYIMDDYRLANDGVIYSIDDLMWCESEGEYIHTDNISDAEDAPAKTGDYVNIEGDVYPVSECTWSTYHELWVHDDDVVEFGEEGPIDINLLDNVLSNFTYAQLIENFSDAQKVEDFFVKHNELYKLEKIKTAESAEAEKTEV